MHLFIEILFWLTVSLFLMSFLEHWIHRILMHKRTFLSDRVAALKKTFEHHAILHHSHYHQIFSDDPMPPGEDRHIRLSLKEGIVEALPFSAVMAIFSVPGAVIFIGVVCSHHLIWNQIHLEMHQPKGRIFSDWPIYKSVVRHHYLHHRYPAKNFNVVLPMADYILGMTVKPSEADLSAMRRLGMY